MTTVRFEAATSEDDEDLRRLVRGVPMEGWVKLGMEREPTFLAGEGLLGEARVMVARTSDQAGALVGACVVTWMPVHVNGTPMRIPYLGGLRLTREFHTRPDLIRQGFKALAGVTGFRPDLPLAFTSLAKDNQRARRLLEAGVRGLPRYEPLAELETWTLATRGSPEGRLEPAEEQDLPALLDLINAGGRPLQFSPCLDESWLRSSPSGLRISNFLVRRGGGGLDTCLAVWDQRAFKQVRVHGYRSPLGALRPALNLLAPLRRGVRLPAPGSLLEGGFLAFARFRDPDPASNAADLAEALAWAARRGLEVVYLGLPAGHPLGPYLRRGRAPWTYRTLIEGVNWPDSPALKLEPGPVHPEIALL